MTTMRPKWSTVSQLRPNRPLRALSKGAMSSTGARHRPLRSLILLTLLSATLAVGLVPTATAATGSQQALAAAATTTTWPTLRYGARGTAVVYLQQRLTTLHYDVGGVDGIFGYNTLHAVYAFQKVQGITVDGIVGPITWSRLASPYRLSARYYRSTAAVEVNLTRRVVYLTRSGAVTRILDASPGKPSTPTPTGSFSIYRRSHGCVRVNVPAMNRAWSQLYIGERLYVYR